MFTNYAFHDTEAFTPIANQCELNAGKSSKKNATSGE